MCVWRAECDEGETVVIGERLVGSVGERDAYAKPESPSCSSRSLLSLGGSELAVNSSSSVWRGGGRPTAFLAESSTRLRGDRR